MIEHLIHLMLNLLEGFLFPFFIANYFNLDHKKRFIGIVSIIQFFILTTFHYLFTNNIILTLTIISSMLLSIYIYTGKVTFNNFFITILYNCLIYISALTVLIINNGLTTLFHFWFTSDVNFFLLSCVISRLILLIVTILILKKKLNFSVSFDFRYWSYVIFFEFLLLSSIGFLIYSLTFNEINNTILITLLIFLVIMAVLFILHLYHINELNKAAINIEKAKQIEKFNSQKLNAIKNVKNEIDSLNHRMFYVYFNLEILLKQKKYQEAYELLISNRRHSTKYDIIIDTNNLIFDCLVSLKINDLIAQDKDINLCIFISESEFYNSLSLINSITSLINCFQHYKKMTLNIIEKSNYTIIKMICMEEVDFDIPSARKIIYSLSKSYKIYYELGGQIENSIKISIKREENDGI